MSCHDKQNKTKQNKKQKQKLKKNKNKTKNSKMENDLLIKHPMNDNQKNKVIPKYKKLFRIILNSSEMTKQKSEMTKQNLKNLLFRMTKCYFKVQKSISD